MDLARTAGGESLAWIERLRGLDPESIRNGTLDQTVIGREIAGEIGTDRLHRLQGVFRANRLALDAYQPRPYPGSVILVQAESSREAVDDGSTAGLACAGDGRCYDPPAPGRPLHDHAAAGRRAAGRNPGRRD